MIFLLFGYFTKILLFYFTIRIYLLYLINQFVTNNGKQEEITKEGIRSVSKGKS
jgi:hypothetical protein